MKACPTCKTEYAGGEVFCPVDGSRLLTPSVMIPAPKDGSDPLVGRVLSERYKILRRVGEGGMGIVYEAMHVVIEKHVALKVLRDDFSSRPEVVERFRQEAKSASRIGHENIVDISDFGETPNGQSYFVMEMLDGEDLADILAREHTLAPKRAVKIIMQCCRALGAAHSKGIVHRDMKPENIFLVSREGVDDFVKIVDFGIAKMSDIETQGAPGRKLTKTGMIFGTPEYMSPEQAAGKPLDHRVDVYALGVILYEMICGRVPFVGDTFMGVLTQHMFEQPPPLRSVNPSVRVPAELEEVIFHTLAKDPAQRYESTDELARALQNAMDLTGELEGGTRVGFGEPVRLAPARKPNVVHAEKDTLLELERPSRGRGAIAVGAVVALLLVAGAGGGYVAWRSSAAGQGEGGGGGVAQNGPGGTTTGTPTVPPLGSQPHGDDAGMPAPMDAGVPVQNAVPPGGGTSPGGTATVAVHVSTRPSGARVFLDGRMVCEQTPCSFDAMPGTEQTVMARYTRFSGQVRFDPARTSSLELTLRAPRAGGESGGREPGGHEPSGGELKLPDFMKHAPGGR